VVVLLLLLLSILSCCRLPCAHLQYMKSSKSKAARQQAGGKATAAATASIDLSAGGAVPSAPRPKMSRVSDMMAACLPCLQRAAAAAAVLLLCLIAAAWASY
jgi:hypothetical protein